MDRNRSQLGAVFLLVMEVLYELIFIFEKRFTN